MIVAYDAEATETIEKIEAGEKLHFVVGEILFGHPIKQGSHEYKLTKKTTHGYAYGKGPGTLSKELEIPFSEAKALLEGVKKAMYYVAGWQKSVEARLKAGGKRLVTPFGRKRHFLAPWNDSLLKEAYAHVGQSTIGDWTHTIAIRFDDLCDCGEILLNTHDGLVIQCKKEDAGEVLTALEEAGDVRLWIRGRECRLPIEIKVGENWGEIS